MQLSGCANFFENIFLDFRFSRVLLPGIRSAGSRAGDPATTSVNTRLFTALFRTRKIAYIRNQFDLPAMTTDTFLYNKKSTVLTMLITAGFMAVITYNLVDRPVAVSDPGWWILIVLETGVFTYILYLYTMRLRPAMQQETALELTPTDLVFKPKNITIPWKTISDINTRAANRSGTQQYLEVSLNDTDNTIRIDLDWIAGDPTDIYTAVVNYLYETRKGEGKSSKG